MRKSKIIIGILFLALFGIVYCEKDTDNNNANTPNSQANESNNLTSLLSTIGNEVILPTNTNSKIKGIVVSDDNDQTGDGLDLTGNGEIDVFYVEGSLAAKKSYYNKLQITRNASIVSVAFYFKDKPNDIYYFLLNDDEIIIATDEEGNNAEAVIVLEDGKVQGIDKENDGTIDEILDFTISCSSITSVYTNSTGYDSSGTIINYTKIIRTSNCKISKMEIFDSSNTNMKAYIDFQYDSNGNETVWNYYDPSGNPTLHINLELDEANNNRKSKGIQYAEDYTPNTIVWGNRAHDTNRRGPLHKTKIIKRLK